jgi:hypothetical protein
VLVTGPEISRFEICGQGNQPVDCVHDQEAAIMTYRDICEKPPGMYPIEFAGSQREKTKRWIRLLVRVTAFEAAKVGVAVAWKLWLR